MRVTIVGLGLIGGSVAIDLRATGFATHLTGVESLAHHCQQAMDRHLVDDILPLRPALVDADLVVLAIPVDAIETLLPKVLDAVGEHTTVTDMGSTKESIVQVANRHARRGQYVAAHPMAGTEHSGPPAAHAGLFAGRTAVICDRGDSDPEHLRRAESLFECLRMRLVWMNSSEHDLHAAYVSHLSHVSSFVLANTVLEKQRDVDTIFDLAGGGFESTVRLAKSSAAMWTPIFEQNRENVLAALDAYIYHLREFQLTLSRGQYVKTKELMIHANKIGTVLARVSAAPSTEASPQSGPQNAPETGPQNAPETGAHTTPASVKEGAQ
jgi:prephenate dehydrogenase